MIPSGPGRLAVEIIVDKLNAVLRIAIKHDEATGRTDIQRDIRKTKMVVIPSLPPLTFPCDSE